MNLNVRSYYAVVALLDLATYGKDALVSAQDIAERHSLSKGLLRSIMAILVAEGLIVSIRGPKGGYQPAKKLSEISIYAVLSATKELPEFSSPSAEAGSNTKDRINTFFTGFAQDIHASLKELTLENIAES